MFSLVGDPRVSVRFSALLSELPDSVALTGSFGVIISDSTTQRTFLPDVRIDGAPLVQEVDQFGSPFRYTLDASALPTLRLADTLRLEVVDGGARTPPFTYVILPSHLTLPPDSTVLHAAEDLTLTWNGEVERVLVTLTDGIGRRLRFNLQVSNYTGLNQLLIPSHDMAQFAPGDLHVSTDVLDDEVRIVDGPTIHSVTMETRQMRVWRIAP